MNGESSRGIVLALAGDHRYAPGLIVALTSALGALSGQTAVTVAIFDEGLTRWDRRLLAGVRRRAPQDVELTFTKGFSALGVDVPVGGHITAASYARLLVPGAIPHAARALYLDADVLVKGDLTPLARLALGDAPVAGCVDRTVPTAADGLAYSYASIGLPGETPYLNAGVLVMNLERWREDDLTGRVLSYLERWRDDVVFHDQDGISAICGSDALIVDPAWNYQQRIEAIHDAEGRGWWRRLQPTRSGRQRLLEARILHFSDAKPWLFPGWLFPAGVSRGAHARWWAFALTSPLLPPVFRARMLLRAAGLVPYVLARKAWRVSVDSSRQVAATAPGT